MLLLFVDTSLGGKTEPYSLDEIAYSYLIGIVGNSFRSDCSKRTQSETLRDRSIMLVNAKSKAKELLDQFGVEILEFEYPPNDPFVFSATSPVEL